MFCFNHKTKKRPNFKTKNVRKKLTTESVKVMANSFYLYQTAYKRPNLIIMKNFKCTLTTL